MVVPVEKAKGGGTTLRRMNYVWLKWGLEVGQ